LNAIPFTWAAFTSGSVAIALLFNFASFIGFEATRSTARRPGIPSGQCHAQPTSRC
jgi:hypothetical protein